MEQTMLIAVLIAALVGLFLFDTVRLRRMQVQVHKARRDDLSTVVVDRHTGWGCFTKCSAAAILTQHIAIPHPQGTRGGNIRSGWKSA